MCVSGLDVMEEYSSATCFFLPPPGTARNTVLAAVRVCAGCRLAREALVPMDASGAFRVLPLQTPRCAVHVPDRPPYCRLSLEVKCLCSRMCGRNGEASVGPACSAPTALLVSLPALDVLNVCQPGGQRVTALCASNWGSPAG